MRNGYTREMQTVSAMVRFGLRSRPELGAFLGLSKGSVSRLVERLMRAGIVTAGGKLDQAQPGRKRTALHVRPDLAYLVGADLEGRALSACVVDCGMNVVARETLEVASQWSMSRIVGTWLDLVDRMVRDCGVPLEAIAGLGLGLPGLVSRGDFRIRAFMPPGRLVEFDLGSACARFPFPVTAANNVVCVSEFERRVGAGYGVPSFISVLARYGIGAAVYANGSFLIGEEGFTGEFGHMRIDAAGPVCICGQRGCLDVYASGRTWLAGAAPEGAGRLRTVSRRGRYLAVALANVLKLFHPPVVIMNGIYNAHADIMAPVLKSGLRDELRPLGLTVPEVRFGAPGPLKASIGAAYRAADAFLEKHLVAQAAAAALGAVTA